MSGENPARASRQAYAWLLAIVLSIPAAYFTLPIGVLAVLLPLALPAAICALAVGAIRAGEARERARVERGEGVVARWRLDGAHWREFERLNAGTVVVPRVAAERLAPPAPGVEVVFAENAVYVDGDYYTMDRGWGTAATLETAHLELAQSGLETDSPLRVPVPPAHRADAERVARHFNSR